METACSLKTHISKYPDANKPSEDGWNPRDFIALIQGGSLAVCPGWIRRPWCRSGPGADCSVGAAALGFPECLTAVWA